MLAGSVLGGFIAQWHINRAVGTFWGEVRKVSRYLTLELGLEGNKDICKVAVYSNFIVFLQNKASQHCSKYHSTLCGRRRVTFAHSEGVF